MDQGTWTIGLWGIIILIVMNGATNEFFVKSPNKIVERAEMYSKTLDNYLQLPKEISKSLMVRSQANSQKQEIEYAIQMSQYQQELFRNKEIIDEQQRERYRKQRQSKEHKNAQNIMQIQKKQQKKNEDYEKHAKQVYERYVETENRNRTQEKDKSYQIRNNLLQFFQKESQRKQKEQRRQVSASTCYHNAVERINNLQRKNEQYARSVQAALDEDLSRNSKYGENISKRRRVLTQQNRRKSRVFHQSLVILNQRENHFIQTCGKNEDCYINAWEKIGSTVTDFRKKRGQETKRQISRWRDNKQRVEEAKASIPQRCVNILDKTSRASFRQTASSFRSSASKYEETVQRNKEAIREDEEQRKDRIMGLHLDLRLRNTASSKVTQKMHSMRQHARKIAYDCL